MQKSTCDNAATNAEIMNTNTEILRCGIKGGQRMKTIAFMSALYAPGAYFSVSKLLI